jgi:hypothetical protein
MPHLGLHCLPVPKDGSLRGCGCTDCAVGTLPFFFGFLYLVWRGAAWIMSLLGPLRTVVSALLLVWVAASIREAFRPVRLPRVPPHAAQGSPANGTDAAAARRTGNGDSSSGSR